MEGYHLARTHRVTLCSRGHCSDSEPLGSLGDSHTDARRGAHCCRPGKGYYGLSDASCQELDLAAFGRTGVYYPGRHHHGQLAGVRTVDNRTLRLNRIDGERLVVHLCRLVSKERLMLQRLRG